jgi:hypothetical protein
VKKTAKPMSYHKYKGGGFRDEARVPKKSPGTKTFSRTKNERMGRTDNHSK